jgi:HAMP domain-containing protein
VRLAADLSDVDAAVAELRRTLLAAGALGMLAALALSMLISFFTLSPLRELAEAVSAIAAGNLERRAHWSSADEVGRIAVSINRVAEELKQRLDEATAEQGRLIAVLEGMAEGVLVLDARGRVVLANPQLRAWPGRARQPAAARVLRHPREDRGQAAPGGDPTRRGGRGPAVDHAPGSRRSGGRGGGAPAPQPAALRRGLSPRGAASRDRGRLPRRDRAASPRIDAPGLRGQRLSATPIAWAP